MQHTSKVKKAGLLFAVSLVAVLTGCNKGAEQEIVEVSEYLNEKALNGGTERQHGSYSIEEVVVGTFTAEVREKADFYIQDSVAAYAEYEYGTMLFDKFTALTGSYVEAGEPIAQVHIEVSQADITAARLSIQRMEERVEADRLMYEKEDVILRREAYNTKGSQAQGVAMREYEASLEHHRQDIEAQHKAIERAKKNLAKMEEADAITSITAPISGYVKDVPTLKYGEVIPNKMIVCIMEPEKSGIITVSNEKNAFRYGKTVKVICKKDDLEKEFTGVVITPSRSSVALQASDRMASIRLDEEGKKYLQENKVNTIEAIVKTVEQENALMVKMGSLEDDDKEDDVFYATVVRDDGSFFKKKVLIGGKSDDCYWVLEGLESTDLIVLP